MPARFQVRFVTDRAKTSILIPDEEEYERQRIISPEDALTGKDEGAYVMLEDIARHFGVQTATVKKRAVDLDLKIFKIRKPEAKNAYCAAVTADEAKKLIAVFREGNLVNNARVLGPDEIKNLMEEA